MISITTNIPQIVSENKKIGENYKNTPSSIMEYNKDENFKIVIEKNAHKLFPIAARLLGNKYDAEEIIQEAFLKLWEKPPQLRKKNALPAWLKKVVVNLAFDRMRKKEKNIKQSTQQNITQSENPEQKLLDQQKKNYMQFTLNQIPKRQKAAIILVYYEEMSNKQAADLMNVSVDALESLLARGRKNLHKIMQKNKTKINNI